jgi:hydroxymethylbilane synthase
MDKKNFTIVCRGSWLSRAQAEIFTRRIQASFPDITTTILIRETAGDKNLSTPLHLVEGKDFFTREIQDTLRSGEADFALHSMKDVSSETFFSESRYAIINREPVQDIAIFNPNVIEKIANGLPIVLGTSSPRRSNMATAFLESVLPNTGQYPVQVTAASVRGNVDARLQKLNAGEYDGLVLAVAGLNRLLQFEPAAPTVRALLANKKMMVLPLFECQPDKARLWLKQTRII